MAWELTQLFVTLKAQGAEAIANSLGTVQSHLASVQNVANAAGGALATKFDLVSQMFNKALGGETKGVVGGRTKELLEMTGALKGWSAAKTFAIGKLIDFHGGLVSVGKGLEKLRDGLQTVGRYGAYVFATLTATLGGFVRAGLQGSAVGEMLNYRFAELARSIAGLFMPEIERVLLWVERIVEWFHNLNDAQLEHLATLAKWVAGLSLAVMIIPTIIGAISSLITAVAALTSAFIVMQAFAGPPGWAALAIGAGIAAAAVIGTAVAFKKLKDEAKAALKGFPSLPGADEVGNNRRALPMPTRGFERPEDVWQRVAEVTVKMRAGGGKSHEEKSEELMEQQLQTQRDMDKKLALLRPAFVK